MQRASEREGVERRLTAILVADVVGYSRLIGADDEGTFARLNAHHTELVEPKIKEHRGRVVRTTGDGLLVLFASVVDALRCAVEMQRGMAERNAQVPPEKRIEFRMGITVGDIIIDGSSIHGDGVNVAARLEALAEFGGICVSGRVQEDVHGTLDITFEDAGEQQLKNIARPVRVYRVRLDKPAPKAASMLPDKPSIAVLSFQNMSGDPQQEYFSDGIAEDIITMLSRSQSLFVIARNSSFTYKARAVDVKQIARELGVRYVLEGSVRRGGNRVRITAKLVDAVTGNHLWAERYDRDPVDIFAVQDEITEAVVIAIEPAVAEMERRRAVRKPPESLGAWEAYQRGLWHLGRIGVTDNEAAKSFLRRAIDLDPSFASAHAELARAIFQGASLYQATSLADALGEALPAAQRAIALDPVDAAAHVTMGLGYFWQGDYDGALAKARQTLAISPNDAVAHHLVGLTCLFSGRPREALEPIRTAMRLDPRDPLRTFWLTHIAIAHYFLREYDAAVEAAKEALRSYPDHPWTHRWLAAALGQLGRFEEAKQALRQAIAVAPKSFDMFVRQRAPWVRVEDYEHMLEGLRKAGWEG
jgi:adenylate cyclase